MTTIKFNTPGQIHSPELDLLCEFAPAGGSFGHIPALPGLCYRGDDIAELERIAPAQITRYMEWVLSAGMHDLNSTVRTLAAYGKQESFNSIPIVIKENLPGSPVWISGNPAALFDYDLHPLDTAEVSAYLRLTQQALNQIVAVAGARTISQMGLKSNQEHRSIDEMLTHVGNCVWWYCSRIDDDLPEPDEVKDETPGSRVMRLLRIATSYLANVPSSRRTTVHVPTRFKTTDPSERWTYTKVIRRQAEHAWEHLIELIEMEKDMRSAV